MKRRFVSDLADGDEVDEAFIVREASLQTTRTGSLYVKGTLADRTGSIHFRRWDAREETINLYPAGGYVRVSGRVDTYPPRTGKRQIVASRERPIPGDEVDPADFEAASACDPDALAGELDRQIASVADGPIRALLEAIFVRDAELRERFLTSPAATDYHHPFRSGLAEHTVAVTRAGIAYAEMSDRVDRDLLVAGCLLHDLGKIEELVGGAAPEYTEAGRLAGHIVLAAMLVERKIRELEAAGTKFPETVRLAILHLVLSHHGTKEFGSPVLPATPEAFAVHHLDNLDAKVEASHRQIETDAGQDEAFSEYSRMLGVRLYKRRRGKEGSPPAKKSKSPKRK